MRAENRDLDHPGGSPVSSFSPEMLPMEEFWVERGQAEGGAGRRPRQDGLAARAAAAGAWEAMTASGPRWLASIPARAPPSTARKSRWPTSQSPPGTWPSRRAGRGSTHSPWAMRISAASSGRSRCDDRRRSTWSGWRRWPGGREEGASEGLGSCRAAPRASRIGNRTARRGPLAKTPLYLAPACPARRGQPSVPPSSPVPDAPPLPPPPVRTGSDPHSLSSVFHHIWVTERGGVS